MSQYFPKPYSPFYRNIEAELDLKFDLEKVTPVNTSTFAKIVDLASLKSNFDKAFVSKLTAIQFCLNNFKSKVDKLHFNNYKTAPIPLKKLNDIVDEDIMKRNIL